jgi:hypothetical protein
MYRTYTNIVIQQNGTGRSQKLTFDFCNAFEASDTWVDLTNQGKVTLPKNLYYRDKNNKLVSLAGTNKNIGGFDSENPIFKKGDSISIEMGYRYYKGSNEVLESAKIFNGYITEVASKKPIEIKCEDNMWLLKQIPAKSQTWNGSVENLIADLLKDYPQFKVNKLTQTTIGPIVITNETIAQLLERFRKDANLEAYFRGNELRVGSFVYIPSDAVENTFVFQQNIIDDDLMYKRKDDIVLSAIVVSQFEDLGGTTKDGAQKTKKEKIELLVYWNKAKNDWDYIKKSKGVDFPANNEGERRTLTFANISDINILFQKGVDGLKKYFYTGFKGKFTTFGIPYVKQGDNVIIKDPILPERNGKYKVKGVNYTGGVAGHRQEIILDYLMTV